MIQRPEGGRLHYPQRRRRASVRQSSIRFEGFRTLGVGETVDYTVEEDVGGRGGGGYGGGFEGFGGGYGGVFEGFEGLEGGYGGGFERIADLGAGEEALHLRFEMPGLRKEDMKVGLRICC